MRRHGGELVQHALDAHLAGALNEGAEGLALLALGHVAAGEALDHVRDALGRHGADGQAVRAAILLPLPAQHHLEMRHGVAVEVAADAVEAQIGHVVLAAGVEAAADLDVQALHGFVQGVALGGQALAQLAGQAARGSDAQLAGVGARAGCHVDDGAGASLTQAEGLEGLVQLQQVGLGHPAQDDVLLHGGAHRLAGEAPGQIGQRAQLAGGQVAQGQPDGGGVIAGLALAIGVGLQPALEAFGPGGAIERHGRAQRLLVKGAQAGFAQEGGPFGVVRQGGALFQHQALELVDAELLHQELDAGAVAVFLFAQAGEDAGDGLGGGQQLALGQKGIKQLGLLRHGAQPAADI